MNSGLDLPRDSRRRDLVRPAKQRDSADRILPEGKKTMRPRCLNDSPSGFPFLHSELQRQNTGRRTEPGRLYTAIDLRNFGDRPGSFEGRPSKLRNRSHQIRVQDFVDGCCKLSSNRIWKTPTQSDFHCISEHIATQPSGQLTVNRRRPKRSENGPRHR